MPAKKVDAGVEEILGKNINTKANIDNYRTTVENNVITLVDAGIGIGKSFQTGDSVLRQLAIAD